MKRGCKLVFFILIVMILGITSVSAVDWYQQESGTEEPLFAVSLANERIAYAVGGPGIGFPTFPSSVILKSENGGTTWTPQDSPVAAQLFDVCFVNEDIGWAVGAGVIIYTDDGGDTWIQQATPYETTFWDISCVDRNTAYVVGAVGQPFDTDSNILKLIEGEWVELDSNLETTLLGSYFINENTGYITGQGGEIARTTNGETFEPLDSLERNEIPVTLSAIHCLSEDECWMADTNEIIYRTINGGESWDDVDTGETVFSMGDVWARDSDSIWVVGQQTLRHTDDEGLTWEVDETDISDALDLLPIAFMRDVEFSGNVGLTVGDDGTILKYGEPTECIIIENPCEDLFAQVYNETTGCLEAYLCADLPDRNWTITVPESCQSQYRECIEENYPDHADCDETYEFCDNIDEVLADVQKEYAEKAFSYAAEFKYFVSFLKDEKINIYLSQGKGNENIFGIEISKGSVKSIAPYKEPTISIYISEGTLKEIIKSDDQKSAALNAISKGNIKIEGAKFKIFKVFLFKAGLKISLPFFK